MDIYTCMKKITFVNIYLHKVFQTAPDVNLLETELLPEKKTKITRIFLELHIFYSIYAILNFAWIKMRKNTFSKM